MKYIITILIVFISISGYSQPTLERQVIGNTGGTGGNNNLQVAFTVGEVATITLQSNDLALTQGFHQSEVGITGVKNAPVADWKVTHYPNPAHDRLYLKISGEGAGSLHLQVIDFQGRVVYRVVLETGYDGQHHQIDVRNWAAGTYYLTFYGSSGPPLSMPFQKIK